MWALALRVLAGLGIGEVLDFFKGRDEQKTDLGGFGYIDQAFAGMFKIVIYAVIGIVVYLLLKKKKVF